MKIIISYVCLSIMLIIGFSGVILAQEVIMDHDVKLSEEQKMLWIAYGINPNQIGGVWVYSFKGTPEEAVLFEEKLAKKFGAELPEMHKFESTLGDTIKNTISWYGDLLAEEFGQEWLDSAKRMAVELKDVPQISYIGGFKLPDGTELQINIESPYLSKITMEVYEGTYLIETELKGETKAAEMEKDLGEKITLNSELPVEYLKGEWTVKMSDPDQDNKVPGVIIKIKDYIGSLEETEIEAERFLFSGEIIIGDKVYEAFTDLDNQENMYAYPMRFISILKEEGADPEFGIMVDDMDNDISLSIISDFKWIYENALGVKCYYDNDSYYSTVNDKIDYLIKDN